jgi:hypothetical protein
MDPVEHLRRLAREHFATSASDLKRIARGHGVPHRAEHVAEALRENVATQILHPKPRFAGKSAAEQKGSRIQMDLAEFPVTPNDPNSDPYALVATDVFTRQTYVEPMQSKSVQATDAAARRILDKFDLAPHGFALTTDKGAEFSHLQEDVLQEHDVHRIKAGRNDIAVVDRAMQTLKAKLAAAKANLGGSWQDHISDVQKSYNSSYRGVVHGSPDGAAEVGEVQNFLVTQDNASKFEHNFEVAKKRTEALQRDGAFRPAISDGSRIHKPRYGPVEELGSIEPGALHVVSSSGDKHLLKRVLAVAKASAEPRSVFGTKPKPPPKDRPEGEGPPSRPHRPMTGSIPEPASRVFEPSSSSGSASSSAVAGAAGSGAASAPPAPAVPAASLALPGAGTAAEYGVTWVVYKGRVIRRLGKSDKSWNIELSKAHWKTPVRPPS